MKSIIILSVFIIIGLISIAQYFAFSKECVDKRIRFSYMILSFSLAISAFFQILMILFFRYKVDFVLYGLDKVMRTLLIVEIVYLTRDSIEPDDKLIVKLLPVLSYGAALLYITDIFVGMQGLVRTLGGVYYVPSSLWHIASYFVYYIVYTIILGYAVVKRSSTVIRRSEKYVLNIQLVAFGLSVIGFVSELMLTTFARVYFPFALLLNLISVILMRKSLVHFMALDISEKCFEKELDEGRLDVVFILDEELKVMYQNKRAEVFSKMIKDDFIGRKLSDIFKFDDNAYGQISAEPSTVPFGLSADYDRNGHHVNMIVQHKIDNFNEILATSVIIYNLEDSEVDDKEAAKKNAEGEKQQLDQSIEITAGAKLLVVDDDAVFLNVFARMLKQYKVDVIRARDVNEFRKAIRNNVFDMIFVTNELKGTFGINMVKEVRGLGGDYYGQVPIVIITENDINEMYVEFIASGFSDYLTKPISANALSLVLTRWLWKRYSADKTVSGRYNSAFKNELDELKKSAKYLYDSNRYDRLGYIINAIKKLSGSGNTPDIVMLCDGMLEALLFEDKKQIDMLYSRINMEIDKALTIV